MTTTAPKLLIIETSGSPGEVALVQGEIRARRTLDQARRHARDLAPAARDMLQELGWRPGDIEAVFVSTGPGSYTGLRVGIMSAKAFAYATGCTVLGIDTFAAIAWQSAADASVVRLSVIADAQQEKVYAQRFVVEPNLLPVAESPLLILPLSQWLAQLEPDERITGPGLRSFQHALPPATNVVAERLWDPRPESLLRLGLERLSKGEKDDLWQLEPLYLRPSSAEEKWDARAKIP
jgi:tRNA threonylcarbamoyladenosine biosynthesis protein TsaB